MKKFFILFALAFCISANAQDISWKQHDIDGHRTGVTQMGVGKTTESMGKVKRFSKKYTAPNGKKYRRGATRRVAKIMIAAQDSMSYVKQVIGYSPKVMEKRRPESALTNWFVDALMQKTEELTGRHVDVGFANFGGVRVDMPEGEIFRDDIMSMFPFSNTLYYFTLSGESLLDICKNMASRSPEIFGGMKLVVKDRNLVSATINGEPIDPNKTYGVATLDFLMKGGGWFRFGKYEIEGIDTHVNVLDVMIPYVEELTRQGKKVEYHKDGRYTLIKEGAE